jgi:hypothetical protein
MLIKTTRACALAAFALIFLVAGSARGQISASATMTAAPDGPNNYHYTISLHNTGTTNLETFWFAWIPGYDFLPSQPTVVQKPTGWSAYVEPGTFYGGYSIEFFDPNQTSPITGGQTNTQLQFTSPDSPASLQGPGSIGLPITYSYIYSTAQQTPGVDPVSASNILSSISITPVPEPTGMVLAALGCAALMFVWRSRRPRLAVCKC